MAKMGEMQRGVQYTFDCPVHGLQSQLFCFRAFDPKLRHRWHRFNIVLIEVPLELGEIDKYVDNLEKGTSGASGGVIYSGYPY